METDILRGSIVLVLGLLLTTTAAPATTAASGDDDTGRGTDAPDAPEDAWVLEPGAYHADFQTLDDEDWYIDGASGDASVRWSIHANDRALNVTVVTDIDTWWRDIPRDGWASLRVPPGAKVGIRMLDPWEPIPGDDPFNPSYFVALRVDEPTDVAVTGLRAWNEPVIALLPDAKAGWARTIAVDMENLGQHDARDVRVIVRVHHDDGTDRTLADTTIGLESGESATLKLPWDGRGQVGDATVRAWASPILDVNWSNNHRATTAAWPVEGTGVSADPLNWHVWSSTSTPAGNFAAAGGLDTDVHGQAAHAHLYGPGLVVSAWSWAPADRPWDRSAHGGAWTPATGTIPLPLDVLP